LWRFGGLSVWKLAVRSIRAYRANRFDGASAQFAYYSMLALFPLLILLIAAVARLPFGGVVDNALDGAKRALPDEIYDLLARQIRDIQAHSTVRIIVASLGVFTVAGCQVFLTITDGLNKAYEVVESRRSWQVYGLVFLLTIAVSVLILISLILMIIGPMLSSWIAARDFSVPILQAVLKSGVRWGVVCGFLWIATTTVYNVAPSIRLPWYWFSPGSVFAVVGWVVVSQGFRLYVEDFATYNTTYGALGGVIVLMVWLNLTGAVFLMGGQINGVIHRAETASAGPNAPVGARPT
jgi:membrane protein